MEKIIKQLFATVGICLLIVLLKDEFEKNLLKDANYGLPALIEQGEINNLFLGSSMFRQGIDISELDALGGSDYVLAYNGNQPVVEEWILRYLIRSGVQIDSLYMDMYVYTMCDDPQISDEKIFMEVGLIEKWQLWQIISGTDNIGIEEFLRLFVTGNNEALLTWPVYSKLVDQRFKKGGNITETQGLTKEQIEQLIIPKVDADINTRQKQAVENIIAIAEENGIRLIFVETPKYRAVMEDPDYQKIMKEYSELLDQNNVNYVLAENIWQEEVGEANNFIDLIHLSTQGKIKYTKILVKYLEQLK